MQPSNDRVDDESVKFLLDVRKGRPRKFVMIKDGVEIDKLYVFKKGHFERYVKIAKQSCVRGEAYWGIVRGTGNDIQFELSRSDGFTAPPGTNIRLKEFLHETTSFKFNPEYVIVDAPASVDEDDRADAGVQDSGQAPSTPPEDAGEKFIRLLKSILPHVKRALAVKTSISEELQIRVREAQDLGRQRDFEQGMIALRLVGQLTKQALAEAETAPTDTRAQRIQEVQERRRRQWEERLAQIEPRYDEALRSAAPTAGKLRIVMDYAQTQSSRKQYVKALVGLDRLERMLAEPA